ncbi:type IV secretory system conjugative DNA transfer family protein [Halobacterium sp. KA-6]|uniref:type IV secretory system conjugative DNA transfer family protein n=1 Tax=Halobacterium sp. KA-6 TaxID=2896368 RepID=UPI001E291298|nr:type IV secretory system conjugative DNA transfer family protein [Halobacterium sp. KA-6]MCD2204928.1 type IV secretion system DNA-binding domain-containing protein [Halobacterium sp. KA-6]
MEATTVFNGIFNRGASSSGDESRANQATSDPQDKSHASEPEQQPETQTGTNERPYPITETSTDSVGDIEVQAETLDEGVVAGADIRTMFEVTPGAGPQSLWLGYQKDPHRGFVEAGLPFDSLFRHLWVSGTTGYGKSTMLVNSMTQLANNGHGFVYVDPKGQDSRDLLQKLPEDRLDDVVWVEPGNLDREDTVGLNFLDIPSGDSAVSREEEIETRIETLKAVLSNGEYWGINMESITESMGRAMLQSDTQYSLIDMYYILLEADRREDFAETVEDRYLREFCEEIAGMPDKTIRPLLKRLKAWVESPVIRQIIAHKQSTIDFREIIDNDRIVIVRTPIENSSVKQMISLGVMRQLWTAVRQRASNQDGQPDPYFVFCDEFDDIASPNLDLEGMLARARSNRLSVTLSCQYPSQLDSSTQDAVRNNCDTTLAFSVNAKSDARILMERFQDYSAEDLLGTGRYQLWTKLPREDKGYSNPVRINTFPPYPPLRPTEAIDAIIDASLERYGTPQLSDVEIHEHLVFSDTTGQTALHSEVTAELAAAVRAVQLREDSRLDNDWVTTKAVDAELARRHSLIQHDLDYNDVDLPEIRANSTRFVVDNVAGDPVVRLTDAGETAAKPSTGDVASAGGDAHDHLLFDTEAALTTRGFSVDIREQDGSEQPDATAVYPGEETVYSIEAETTTHTRPWNVLANLARSQKGDHIPLFVVRPGEESETQYASRVESILSPPVRQMSDGSERFYNSDEPLTFNGGATIDGGVTGLRPKTDSKQTVWIRRDNEWGLSDGDTEFASLPANAPISKDSLPAYYSYDEETAQYTVYTPGDTNVYQSEARLREEWTPIKRPFIPAVNLPTPNYDRDSYHILILPQGGQPKRYTDGQVQPLPTSSVDTNPLAGLGESTSTPNKQAPKEPHNHAPASTIQTGAIATADVDSSEGGIETFADLHLSRNEGAQLRRDDLYQAYRTWTDHHEIKELSKSWFTRKLRETIDFEIQRSRVDGERIHVFEDLTLTSQPAD